jgi:Dehydrogenases (flavoproteins)
MDEPERERDPESYFGAGIGGGSGLFTAGGGTPAGPHAPAPAAPSVATVTEPAREIPVHEETDVLVVGGGPAGTAAAVAARRLGQRVTLVERYGDLGGLSAGGLVIWIDRMTDWSGTPVIAGIGAELLGRLPAGALAGPGPELWGSTEPEQVAYWRERLSAFRDTVCRSPMIDPEWLKITSHEFLVGEGVRVLLHSWVVAAITGAGPGAGNTVRGAIFESKQGRRAILAKVVVDATGDLDVIAQAGGEFVTDAKEDGAGGNVQHTINTAFTWTGVDVNRWLAFKRGNPAAHRALMSRGRELLASSTRRTLAGATTSWCSWAPACPATAGSTSSTSAPSSWSPVAAWSPTWTSSAKRPPASRTRGSCSPHRRSAYG